jgi:hypothetical protein
LPVNLKNQNSKRVKGFDDGEVNKQSVTKIESLFLEIDVIAFKQFPLIGTSFKFYNLVTVGNHEIVCDIL